MWTRGKLSPYRATVECQEVKLAASQLRKISLINIHEDMKSEFSKQIEKLLSIQTTVKLIQNLKSEMNKSQKWKESCLNSGKKWNKKAKVSQKWGTSYRIPKREHIRMKISHWWKAGKQPRIWKWHKAKKVREKLNGMEDMQRRNNIHVIGGSEEEKTVK